MRPRLWRNLALVAFASTLVAVILWVLSFRLDYFPPATFLFKWRPTRATPQFQCVWLISAPLTILFVLLAVHSRREFNRRTRLGLCPRCGYDLRATPDRCPECGTIPPPRAPGKHG
jgi:hypothetical protein